MNSYRCLDCFHLGPLDVRGGCGCCGSQSVYEEHDSRPVDYGRLKEDRCDGNA